MAAEVSRVPGEYLRLPLPARAVLAALRLQDPDFELLGSLSERQWGRALEFADRARLTLLLGHVCGTRLPPRIRSRIEADHGRNAARLSHLRSAMLEVVASLEEAGLEYVLLKGFAHGGEFTPAPELRLHYDIDLYCPPISLHAARATIAALGYKPVEGMEDFPTDHLPAMVRQSAWRWRGDMFDPGIPPSVDLHFRLWDEGTERFGAPGLLDFWERRVSRRLGERSITAFLETDQLGYAALHLLRHLLRGSVCILHVYEIAHFLQQRNDFPGFWNCWRRLHAPGLRKLEAIAFELARRWFHCSLPAEVQREVEALPASIRRWMDLHAAAPLESWFRPNKSEIWLHLLLVDSPGGSGAVLRQRIMPWRLPASVDPPSSTRGLRRALRYWLHVLRRLWHHVRVLPRFAFESAGWYLARGTPGRAFLLFLIAANTFSFGVFVFVLLYNLLLLDLGFREGFLGIVNGAMIGGNIAGALATPFVVRRLGLRNTLVLGSALAAALFALRAQTSSETAVLASAVASGVALSVWMTSLIPAVTSLTDERQRPAGFSLWIGTGIATGIAGGLIGSRLPGWLWSAGLADTTAGAKVLAILCGCGVSLLSLAPLLRVSMPDQSGRECRLYPRGRFVLRYLSAFAIWSFAIGAFNPFFNAYFARNFGAAVERIGGIYSAAQLVQALGIAAAPMLLRKAGLPRGTALLQAAAAVALAGMAGAPALAVAAVWYACFMAFQVMCEPGVFSLLMDRVKPAERVGASGLNSLTMFGAQALAAAGAGWAFGRFGYPATLSAAGGLALLSAWLFRRLDD